MRIIISVTSFELEKLNKHGSQSHASTHASAIFVFKQSLVTAATAKAMKPERGKRVISNEGFKGEAEAGILSVLFYQLF